jgi:hypothetical protein
VGRSCARRHQQASHRSPRQSSQRGHRLRRLRLGDRHEGTPRQAAEAAALERDFINSVQGAGYTLLPIEISHALRAGRLAGDHRDPFGRILAAQALAEDIPILSMDKKLDTFGITRIW